MQIVPGNALNHTVPGSAGTGGANRTEPHAQAAAHGQAQAAGVARPGEAPSAAQAGAAQRTHHVERPIPDAPRPNAAPGSVLDIRV